MAAETIKLVLIWLHCLHALLCIAFIADLILILLLSGFYRWFCGAARQICFNQSEALPRSGQWYVISIPCTRSSDVNSRGNQWGVGCFLKLYYSGRVPGARPPLFFDQNEVRRAEKSFFGDRPPPTYIRVWMTAPHPPPPPPFPLIWRSGFATDSCIYFSVNPRRKQSWTSPKSLKLPLQFVAHSFHQV